MERFVQSAKEKQKPKIPVDGSEDLNKFNDQQLNAVKENMESEFVKNQVKPTDDEFTYDKRVDFGKPIDKSEWDESEEEIEEIIDEIHEEISESVDAQSERKDQQDDEIWYHFQTICIK